MKYVGYQLFLEEPVKMGTHGDMANTDSLGYIAGSTIRGTFINAFLKIHQGEYDTQSLFVNTRFSDAYPMFAEKKLIPIPALFYANKYTYRSILKARSKALDDAKEIDVRSLLTNSKREDSDQRLDMGSFGEFYEDVYVAHATKKCVNLHINTVKKDMFRYEAIERGQTFYGYIACENEEMAKAYKDMLQDKVFYLGGSRGSGYGRCRVVAVDDIVEYEEVRKWYPERKDQDGKLFVYALSNLYMLDSYGNATGEFDLAWLGEKLGVTITGCETASIGIFQTSGFNNHWGAGNVQASAVGAGSFYVFTCIGTPDEQKIRELEETGVGNRRQEGFGRILINPGFTQNKKKFTSSQNKPNEEPVELSSEDHQMIQMIRDHVNARRIESNISALALEIIDEISDEHKEKLNTTQLSRIYTFLDSVLYNSDNLTERAEGFIARLKNENDEYKNSNVRRTFKIPCLFINGRKRSFEDVILKDVELGVEKWNLWTTIEDSLPYTQEQMKLMLVREIAYAYVRQEGGNS